MSGHQVEVAARIGVGHAPAQHFDREQNGSEGVVELVHRFIEAEAQGLKRGRGGEAKKGHGGTEQVRRPRPRQSARLPESR